LPAAGYVQDGRSAAGKFLSPPRAARSRAPKFCAIILGSRPLAVFRRIASTQESTPRALGAGQTERASMHRRQIFRCARAFIWGCASSLHVFVACTVDSSDPIENSDSQAQSEEESDADESGDSSAQCTPERPPELRRLTPEQYQNTVRALFPELNWLSHPMSGNPRGAAFDHFSAYQQPSPLWVYQIQQNAVSLASSLRASDPRLLQCLSEESGDDRTCIRDWIEEISTRARRHQVNDEAIEYGAVFDEFSATHSLADAIDLALQTLFQDPFFIYHVEWGGEISSDRPELIWARADDLANRMAYLLWNAPPDDELWRAAQAGELAQESTLRLQARRMLDDPQAKQGLRNFFRQLFELDKIDGLSQRKTQLGPLNAALEDAMREETLRRVDSQIWRGTGKWRDLLLGTETQVNADLARLYEVEEPAGQEWETRELDATRRAGWLTQISFLATQSVHIDPSPVRRGRFILERLLCRPQPLPQASVDLSVPVDPTTAQTNRERFEAHTADPACASCHLNMDAIGFAFEAYDALGRWRDLDAGKPIDDSGFIDLDGVHHTFKGPVELGALLGASTEVEKCMVMSWFSYALARTLREDDACEVDALHQRFAFSGGNLRQLLEDIVISPSFRMAAKGSP
jgi:hypothetical protein